MTAPLSQGLFDKSITDIPAAAGKQRYMTSVAPPAEKPGLAGSSTRACRIRWARWA